MKTTKNQAHSQRPISSHDGVHFYGSTNVHGDVINDSIIIQISKPDFWSNALQEWNESIFRWSAAPERAHSSWAKKVIYAFSSIERIESKFIFQMLATITLWIATAWLVTPMMVWPHKDQDALAYNALFYGIATWLIPLLVGLFTVPDQIEERHIATHKQQRALLLLKFTGAAVGFWLLSIVIIVCPLILYYIGIFPPSPTLRNGLALLPLIFSYIVARTMPADRLTMYDGEFKLHPADRFFFIVSLFLGPIFALLLYGMSDILNDRVQGAFILLAASLVAAFWAYKKQTDHEVSDPLAILFLGAIIPICIAAVTFTYSSQPPQFSQEWLSLSIVFIYLLSETILIATLLIRKQITLAGRGKMGLLLFFLLLNIIIIINAWLYRTNLWPTVIVITTIVMIWHIWGQKRFGHHLWIHPSFWIMQASLGTSIYLLRQGWLPLWLNALLTLSASVIVIRWAYQRPISEGDEELPVTEDR